MNMMKMMKQAADMQKNMKKKQKELEKTEVQFTAGGGMVTAVVTGQLRVLEIRFETGLLQETDRDMLQDLTAAAVNAALEKAQRGAQEAFQRLQSGLVIPGGGNPAGGPS